MSIQIAIRLSILIPLLALVPAALAQPKSAGVDPQSKPRKIKRGGQALCSRRSSRS